MRSDNQSGRRGRAERDGTEKMELEHSVVFGGAPFLIAIGFCFVTRLTGSWSFWDYLIMYSFLYWPTYVIGIALIALSAVKMRKKR